MDFNVYKIKKNVPKEIDKEFNFQGILYIYAILKAFF